MSIRQARAPRSRVPAHDKFLRYLCFLGVKKSRGLKIPIVLLGPTANWPKGHGIWKMKPGKPPFFSSMHWDHEPPPNADAHQMVENRPKAVSLSLGAYYYPNLGGRFP